MRDDVWYDAACRRGLGVVTLLHWLAFGLISLLLNAHASTARTGRVDLHINPLQDGMRMLPAAAPDGPAVHRQAGNAEGVVAARRVRILEVTPSPVQASTPTPVTVTARVDVHSTLLPGTVSLYELEPVTEQPILLAIMGDNGTDGDVLEGDNVFTAVVALNRPSAIVFLQAAASYSDLAQPVRSDLVRLFVQEAGTPAQTLANAATLIEKNDIEGALAYFAASKDRADGLRQLNPQQRARLASFFRSLALTRDHGDVRVYHGPWVTRSGETIQIEVGLTRNDLGRWVIFSW